MFDKTNTAELAIAQAQDASRNKFADSAVSAAHARLIEAVITNKPPTAADASEYIANLARAFDEVVYQVVREVAYSATTNVSFKDRMSVVSDALHDSDVTGDLREFSESQTEAETTRSDFDEHNTMHRAFQGV